MNAAADAQAWASGGEDLDHPFSLMRDVASVAISPRETASISIETSFQRYIAMLLCSVNLHIIHDDIGREMLRASACFYPTVQTFPIGEPPDLHAQYV